MHHIFVVYIVTFREMGSQMMRKSKVKHYRQLQSGQAPGRTWCAQVAKAKVKRIVAFLKDVHESPCEGDDVTTTQMQLTALYRVGRLLMDATFKAQDQDLKVLLASLEYRTRQYKHELERRLGVRN